MFPGQNTANMTINDEDNNEKKIMIFQIMRKVKTKLVNKTRILMTEWK